MLCRTRVEDDSRQHLLLFQSIPFPLFLFPVRGRPLCVQAYGCQGIAPKLARFFFSEHSTGRSQHQPLERLPLVCVAASVRPAEAGSRRQLPGRHKQSEVLAHDGKRRGEFRSWRHIARENRENAQQVCGWVARWAVACALSKLLNHLVKGEVEPCPRSAPPASLWGAQACSTHKHAARAWWKPKVLRNTHAGTTARRHRSSSK